MMTPMEDLFSQMNELEKDSAMQLLMDFDVLYLGMNDRKTEPFKSEKEAVEYGFVVGFLRAWTVMDSIVDKLAEE